MLAFPKFYPQNTSKKLALIGGPFSCPATNRCQPKAGRRKVYKVVVGKKVNKPFFGLNGIFFVEVVIGDYARDRTRRKATAYFFKESYQMAQELRGFVYANRFSSNWTRWGMSVSFDLTTVQLGQVNLKGVFSTTIDWTRAELAEFSKKREAKACLERGELLNKFVKQTKDEKAISVGMYPSPVQMLADAKVFLEDDPVQSALYPLEIGSFGDVISNELDQLKQGLSQSWNGLINKVSVFFPFET